MAAVVRTLTRGEIGTVITWAQGEGWTPGANDEAAFCATDDGAFLGAFIGTTMVGCISLTIYSDTYAFLGFFIVSLEHRRKGIGALLWTAAMTRAGKDRVVGLDGVVAQVARYERSGFKRAYRHLRMAGVLPSDGSKWKNETAPQHVSVVPFDTGKHFDALLKYEQTYCLVPAIRPAFLRAWVTTPGHITRILVSKTDYICGYAVLRPACDPGVYKIAPVFAADLPSASALVAALISDLPAGSRVLMDVPEPNEDAMSLANKLELRPVFECWRMYAQGEPLAVKDGARVFANTSLELG